MNREHQRPVFLEDSPRHLISLPWIATSGEADCPCEYNNDLHAAVHSLLSAMQMDELDDAIEWMLRGRDQLRNALRAARKPGASVPVVGRVYDCAADDDSEVQTLPETPSEPREILGHVIRSYRSAPAPAPAKCERCGGSEYVRDPKTLELDPCPKCAFPRMITPDA